MNFSIPFNKFLDHETKCDYRNSSILIHRLSLTRNIQRNFSTSSTAVSITCASFDVSVLQVHNSLSFNAQSVSSHMILQSQANVCVCVCFWTECNGLMSCLFAINQQFRIVRWPCNNQVKSKCFVAKKSLHYNCAFATSEHHSQFDKIIWRSGKKTICPNDNTLDNLNVRLYVFVYSSQMIKE